MSDLFPNTSEQIKIHLESEIKKARSTEKKDILREILKKTNELIEQDEEVDIAECNLFKRFTKWVDGAGGASRVGRLLKVDYTTVLRQYDGTTPVQPMYEALLDEGERYAYWRKKAKALMRLK
jgi:hypothetical protein